MHVVAPEIGTEVRAWADAGRVTVSERGFEPGDLDGAWLATTATGAPAVDHEVFAAGEARRVWVNSADDPANCSFTLTSVVRRGDLVVTVGTGGRSPALATWLRRRFTRELGPEVRDTVGRAVRGERRAAGIGAFQRGSRLAVGARFRHARPDPRRARGRSQGDPPGMSLVVVGLNHRTVPVGLLERMAVAPEALPKALQSLAARRAPRRGRGAVDVQPHRDLRAAPRSSTRRCRKCATSSPTPRASTPTSSPICSTPTTTTPRWRTCSAWPPASTP